MSVPFQPFLDSLRRNRVPVGLKEWLILLKALDENLVEPDFTAFYQTARAIVVRDENDFAAFDKAFVETFKPVLEQTDLLREILENMADREKPLAAGEDLIKRLKELGFDDVLENFFEQLRQGHYKGHVGGNKAIGKRGTSTQGADGFNPAGIRIGQDKGRHGKAIQIAEWRRFHEYNSRRILDTRQMQAALRLLKKALPTGPRDELNIDKTIDETARNGGEIELVFDKRKVPTARVLLLLDVGGSMDPFAEMVSRLFSAARSQIRDLKSYYFHNCVYQEVWQDAARYHPVPAQKLIDEYGQDHWLILCGDAAMSPYELGRPGGAIDMWYRNDRPGIEYLMDLQKGFMRSVWLNPEPQNNWEWAFTIRQIQEVFRMYPLTLDGLGESVRYLKKGIHAV